MFFIPVFLLYEFIKNQFGDSWLAVGIFFFILVFGRIGLFFYRRTKGLKDTYLDD